MKVKMKVLDQQICSFLIFINNLQCADLQLRNFRVRADKIFVAQIQPVFRSVDTC